MAWMWRVAATSPMVWLASGCWGRVMRVPLGRRMPAFSRVISRDGVAEVLLVVEGDVGDDGEEGFDDVGGVEAASHAHFEDGDVDFLLREVEEGQGGEGFEEAGVVGRGARFGDQAAGGVVDLEVEAGEVVVGDLVPSIWMRSLTRERCGEV